MTRKKHGKKQKKLSAEMPPLPDRRAMEAIMRQLIPGTSAGDETPLDRAQSLMYDTFEAPPKQRAVLAKKALNISPDCADAYVLLAEHASSLTEATQLYRQGVAAGQRAIGEQGFEEYRGHFWGVLKTRPYMRALGGLAQCLWDAGQRDEAIEQYERMLDLNPNDNQGIRYPLAAALLDVDRNDDLARLLGQFEDDGSADWAYSAALLAFRQEGDSPRARGLLRDATKTNKHVPAYLLGNRPIPRELPDYISPGGEDEAVCYASRNLSGWKGTPGAITWLRSVLRVPVPQTRSPRRQPWSRLRPALLGLPQREDEVWQVDAQSVEAFIDGPDSVVWLLCATSPTDDAPVAVEFSDTRPTTTVMWDHLVQAMLKPAVGDPRRPGRIEVRRKTFFSGWKAKLGQIAVDCQLRDSLDHADEVYETAATSPLALGRPAALAEGLAEGDLDYVAGLPQEPGDVWQVDVRQLDVWISGEGEPERPWCVVVTSRTSELVLAHDLRVELPDADWLWATILQAIVHPAAGPPHRPGTIEVRWPGYRDALGPQLEPIGIECIIGETLKQAEFVFKDMGAHLAGGSNATSALIDVPGMSREQVGDFFAAAADFYRARPWRQVPGDVPIEVVCDKFQAGPWYAVVMGQMGMSLGLSLHEGLQSLDRVLSGGESDESNARHSSAVSLIYGEAFDIAPEDLDAAEESSWPVAGPEAYPWAFRVNPGLAVRPPLAWELDLLAGCLRAIPRFLGEVPLGQRQPLTVASGGLSLRLAWMED